MDKRCQDLQKDQWQMVCQHLGGNQMAKISLKEFIEKHTGKAVANPEEGSFKGECVSLVQMYLYECFGIGFKARGNAKDYCNTLIKEGLAKKVTSPKYGDIIGWNADDNLGELGHVAIYLDKNTCFDQSNGKRKTAQKRTQLAGADIYVRMKEALVADEKEEHKLKFKIGDKVVVDGPLYRSSTDSKAAGNVKDHVTVITRIAEGAAHPYNTTGDLGWMSEDDIKKYDGQDLNKGTKVKIIKTGKASANGKGATAGGIGWQRRILAVHKGEAYPYQVGNNEGTTGFYKADALKKI